MNNDELPFLLGNSGMVQTESNNIWGIWSLDDCGKFKVAVAEVLGVDELEEVRMVGGEFHELGV